MDQAAALLKLQEADTDILRLNKRLNELPVKRSILETRAKMRQMQDLHDKADLLLKKLGAEKKSREDEVATLTTKIDEEQAKLVASTDHRQVQALSREMDGLKRRRDKVEMEIRQFAEKVDKAEDQRARVELALEAMADQEKELIAQYQRDGGELQQQIHTRQAERATFAGGLDADLLAAYETARDSKGGVGVGRLEGPMCTACRMPLPTNQLAALNEGDDIGTCPSCSRLIVVRLSGTGS